MLNHDTAAKSSGQAWRTVSSMALALLSACATTQKAPIPQASMTCGLLGDVCERLIPGGKDQAGLRYVSPSAQWTKYNKVMIDPVTFWGGDSTPVSALDQQLLVNYFAQQLQERLGKKFQIAAQAGLGVMKLSVAMTDSETAMPVLRTISMNMPQAHMPSDLKYLATGTFPFVGGAQAEAKITDSVTGDLLGAVADKRIGGGSFTTGFQWQWSDAENTIDTWCEKIAERLATWTTP